MARQPFGLIARTLSALWFRITLALFGGYLAILPIGFLGAWEHRQALDAAASVRRLDRVAGSARQLQVALTLESAGLRSYVQTGDASLLDGYDGAQAEAGVALDALTVDGSGTALDADLPALRAAADTWQRWAVGRRSGPPAGGASLGPGEALLSQALTTAARVEARAWTLAAQAEAEAGASSERGLIAAAAGPIGGSLLLVILSCTLLWLALRPVTTLARAANRLAGGLEADIPYVRRRDEVGVVARALMAWRGAVASQRLIWQHSPIAMLIFGADFAIRGVNPAQLVMFRADPRRVTEREFMTTAVANATHPDFKAATTRMYGRLLAGESDTESLEKRYLRNDGTEFWGSCVVTLIRDAGGAPDHFVCMVEDITDRRERLERAAQVQRDLLPDAAPVLAGYDLAGVCRPSREMGGDFYDWQRRGPGSLTLTLGDVMGKDMPAALLMATVAAALRASAAQASVADAVESVAASTERDLERAGAFVTLFHGWLDPGSGTLRYVDAGHGLLAVVGREGVRRPPRARSLPLGVLAGERYPESTLTLAPGESLVVFSDGVLDVHPELEERPDAVAGLLAGARSAAEMAERLVTGPGSAHDDLTTLVLCRGA